MAESTFKLKRAGRPQNKARGRKQKASNFFITINTNKHFPPDPNEEQYAYIKKFNDVYTGFFSQPPSEFIKVMAAADSYDDSVVSIQMDKATEWRSSRTGMLNAHILIRIKHYTRLQFDIPKLTAYLVKEMELKGVHVNVQHIGTDAGIENALNYMRKEPQVFD